MEKILFNSTRWNTFDIYSEGYFQDNEYEQIKSVINDTDKIILYLAFYNRNEYSAHYEDGQFTPLGREYQIDIDTSKVRFRDKTYNIHDILNTEYSIGTFSLRNSYEYIEYLYEQDGVQTTDELYDENGMGIYIQFDFQNANQEYKNISTAYIYGVDDEIKCINENSEIGLENRGLMFRTTMIQEVESSKFITLDRMNDFLSGMKNRFLHESATKEEIEGLF